MTQQTLTWMDVQRSEIIHIAGRENVYVCLQDGCPDTTGHMRVDVYRGLYYCYRCSRGGRLSGPCPPSLRDQDREGRERQRDTPPRVQETQERDRSDTYTPVQNGRFLKYLHGRGMTNAQIRVLEPHQGPDMTTVYFPVRSISGDIIYWVGRSLISQAKIRYWFPPRGRGGIGKSEVLWGIHRIPDRSKRLVIVEGIFDAVHATDRVAIFGSSMSTLQMELIHLVNPQRIYVALDGDASRSASKLIRQIARACNCPLYKVDIPIDTDPDGLGSRLEHLIQQTERSL